jgi:spermidine synthase
VPSVKNAFSFYHADAADVLRKPKGRIIIDDGRRYLKRTRKKFDVIVIDPPPPVEAAGSSLLYSEEFYTEAKEHLKPYGILQAWFPGGSSSITQQAVIRSLQHSFLHVRCFGSVTGWGIHILASMEAIDIFTPRQLATTMPMAAAEDLLEWSDSRNLPGYLDLVLSKEVPLEKALNPDPDIRITDDRPFNEYFLLRQWGLF